MDAQRIQVRTSVAGASLGLTEAGSCNDAGQNEGGGDAQEASHAGSGSAMPTGSHAAPQSEQAYQCVSPLPIISTGSQQQGLFSANVYLPCIASRVASDPLSGRFHRGS